MRCKDMRNMGLISEFIKERAEAQRERKRELIQLRKKQAPIVALANDQVIDECAVVSLPLGRGDLCFWCGLAFSRSNERLLPSKEHIIPRFAGGTNASWNIAKSHRYCNNRRGHDVTWVPFTEHRQSGRLLRREDGRYVAVRSGVGRGSPSGTGVRLEQRLRRQRQGYAQRVHLVWHGRRVNLPL